MPFSDTFLDQALNGGADPIIKLMRVKYETEVLYFADNTENIVSSVSGEVKTYSRSRFEIALPDDTEEGTPKASLTFEAADLTVVRALRSTDEPLTVDIWMVLGSNPNYIEFGPVNYQSTAIDISDSSVKIDLEVEPVLQVKVPRDRFTPNTFPGLFEGA